jgi:hypothetical protein
MPTEMPIPKPAEAVGTVAGIANRTIASNNKRMMYLFLMMSLQLMEKGEALAAPQKL